jgi:hypothetical protein
MVASIGRGMLHYRQKTHITANKALTSQGNNTALNRAVSPIASPAKAPISSLT